MGRPALSDEAKKAKGTFDPRYSKEARVERAGSTVVAFPALAEIPTCRFPLKPGEIGEKTFNDLVRTLHEQKRLTVMSLLELELIATGLDSIHTRMGQGKSVPASAYTTLLTRLDHLQRMDLDRAYVGSAVQEKTNKFAGSGFATRKR